MTVKSQEWVDGYEQAVRDVESYHNDMRGLEPNPPFFGSRRYWSERQHQWDLETLLWRNVTSGLNDITQAILYNMSE